MAGTQTRLQMQNEITDNLAKSGSLALQSGTLLSSRIVDYLNRAQLLIARQKDYLQATATASTVVDQQTYTFPTKFRSIYDIRLGLSSTDVNSRKLICVMPEKMDEQIPAPGAYTSQIPWFYVPYLQTQTFELFPIPGDTYVMRLRYSYFPTTLSTDAQLSDYTDLDDALVAFGTMYGFRWMQELKDAAYWEQTGNNIITQYDKMIQEQYPDWAPYSEGFSVSGGGYTGEYWNNPFVRQDSITSWR